MRTLEADLRGQETATLRAQWLQMAGLPSDDAQTENEA